MADLEFASLRHEIDHYVRASSEPLTNGQLMQMCKLAADEKAMANALYQMCAVDQLSRHPAPDGAGMGVRWAYGPGRVKLGAIDEGEASGGGAASPKARGRAKRPKAKSGRKQVRKVQRKTAKRRGADITFPQPGAGFGRITRAVVDGTIIESQTRWALASDGAFVLLGTQIEIPKPAARALVDFVRALDQAEA